MIVIGFQPVVQGRAKIIQGAAGELLSWLTILCSRKVA